MLYIHVKPIILIFYVFISFLNTHFSRLKMKFTPLCIHMWSAGEIKFRMIKIKSQNLQAHSHQYFCHSYITGSCLLLCSTREEQAKKRICSRPKKDSFGKRVNRRYFFWEGNGKWKENYAKSGDGKNNNICLLF